MDNFDHDERTSSGIGGSHHTILMLFQNSQNSTTEPQMDISRKPETLRGNKKSLGTILPCQRLLKRGKFGRGKIPESFLPSEKVDYSYITKASTKEHRLWVLARYLHPGSANIPSFPATKSLLTADGHSLTKCAFTPILPHPATEADTIYTTMINFQDVLKQKHLNSGPLWSDEGVYSIAREIQLCQPDKSSNIFLGIGGFHLEKVIICCLGAYLETCGIKHIFVEQEIFGPGVVNTVMNGGHYVRGKRGMTLLAETMEQLQIKAFLQQCDIEMFGDVSEKITLLQSLKGNSHLEKVFFLLFYLKALQKL